MASPLDIVQLPGYPGHYMRRAAAEAWARAGSPRPRSTGRLYSEQKALFDGWQQNKPGFSPADNPDATWQMLAHVRFVAIDIWDDYARWRPRMLAAGFLPLAGEAWHFYLPNPQQYPLVTSIPSTAGSGSSTFEPGDDNDMGAIDPTPANEELIKRWVYDVLKFDARLGGRGNGKGKSVMDVLGDLAAMSDRPSWPSAGDIVKAILEWPIKAVGRAAGNTTTLSSFLANNDDHVIRTLELMNDEQMDKLATKIAAKLPKA